VTDNHLEIVFSKYQSFQKAKVIRERINGKSKGYGFISFKTSKDYIEAMKKED